MPERPVPQIIHDKSLSRLSITVDVDKAVAGQILSLIGFSEEDIPLTRIVLQEESGPFGGTVWNDAQTTRKININVRSAGKNESAEALIHEAKHLYDMLYHPDILKKDNKIKSSLMILGGVAGFSLSMLLAISEFTNKGDYNIRSDGFCLITPLLILLGSEAGWALYYGLFSPLEKRAGKTTKDIVAKHPEFRDVLIVKPQNIR